MEAQSRPRRRADYRLEEMDGELLLFDPNEKKVLYCNETAALVWQLCDGERSVTEMTELLVESFPEASDTIPNDVRETLHLLAEHGAIETV